MYHDVSCPTQYPRFLQKKFEQVPANKRNVVHHLQQLEIWLGRRGSDLQIGHIGNDVDVLDRLEPGKDGVERDQTLYLSLAQNHTTVPTQKTQGKNEPTFARCKVMNTRKGKKRKARV
jgi:hypothetical protein